uniref:Metalloendopeptidase n=1 Tax=Maylandia zebra TaxID=106582 RepID=A0A3P9B4B1_9CICH
MSTIINENILWTSPVPYLLNNDLDINSKGVILRAFDQFRLKSCIDFKPRDSEDYYISVKQLNGCWSYIGKASRGQELSIGIGCGYIAIVEHEFLHALGFYHEQSRYDRDDYVTINSENILEAYKHNFRIVSSDESTTHGVPYDYLSVMHYGKDDFTNGNGSTIITKDPKFQNLIGQRVEMSTSDVQELNLLYKCSKCSKIMGTSIHSDHTNLPSGNGNQGKDAGYFMYASTESGQEGDSAWLETKRMSPQRECHVQCLQFYYYHNGSQTDKLNIWIREFQDEWDSTGTRYLMGQISGPPTSHWTLHHVPLNATKQFQVEFEVRKGAGNSTGGFSIDDINLSELECPDGTWQINDFERFWNSTHTPALIYSPRQYSSEGYAYRVALYLRQTDFGVYVHLVSGVYDDQLKWPCPERQFTVQMVDQNPNIQLQMSRQMSLTTDPNLLTTTGTFVHFTIDALQIKISQTLQELETLLPSPILEEVYKFVDKAQRAQHSKGKERQRRKFHTLLSKTHTPHSEPTPTQPREENTPEVSQEKWVKNFSDRNLTETEKRVIAKGLNFAISPQQLPIVDLITATESAIRINKLSQTEAEQIRMKVSATLSSAKVLPSNLTIQEKKAIASLSKDHNITVLPADKGRCTVVLNRDGYRLGFIRYRCQTGTFETVPVLKQCSNRCLKNGEHKIGPKTSHVQLVFVKR